MKKVYDITHCRACGKFFRPTTSYNQYCSLECQSRYNRMKQRERRGETEKKICAVCGKEFKPKNHRMAYCSAKCRDLDLKRGATIRGEDRPFTSSTVYLVHKYNEEGMNVEEIASLLYRSVASIIKALETPITESEKRSIEYYKIIPKRGTKKKNGNCKSKIFIGTTR